MKNLHRLMFAVCVTVALLAVACQTVPLTGRHQLMLISPDEERNLGEEAYKKAITSSKLSQDQAATDMVRRVGERIAKAANRPDYHWEFNLVEDKTPNAFCLPGGKVVVYTGILPFTKDETGLAVVVGHEVAHALARHGAERMSTGLLTELAGKTAGIVFGGGNPQTEKQVEEAFGIGSNVGIMLPFSRHQESEADEIGLFTMAKAGYDPRQAIEFWQRMEQAKNGKPPEFLSTHPSDETRVKRIEGWMPEALKIYGAQAK
ncbi:MAG: M48 family metallopeptidase [Nitrospirae bacterium]|nr:M48 family metallopeptidase [Nitrospirota bacterium]